MLRRIRELQVAGPFAGHVKNQHVISKVLIRRFAAPWGFDRASLICPFRLEYPAARHQPIGADGCGKIDNFVAWASSSLEALWKETEDRMPDALTAMDAGTLFDCAEHVSVIKSAIALHFARSKATQAIHARVWAQTVASGRRRWLTEHRQLLASWFYLKKGLYPVGDEALGRFADELMAYSHAVAGSGALWRERIESLYLQARAISSAAGLEVFTSPPGEEFLIGDVPALTVRTDCVDVGVLGGIALAEAHTVILPLGPQHVAALGRSDAFVNLTADQVAELNWRQLRGAIDYVYLRPGSPLMDTVRSFAEQRKTASERAA